MTARQEPTVPDADPLARLEALADRADAREDMANRLVTTTALRAAIAEARALLGDVEVREEWRAVVHTEGAKPYEYAPTGRVEAEAEADRLFSHLAPGMFNGRPFVRADVEHRTITTTRHVTDWQPVEIGAQNDSSVIRGEG